MAYSDFIEPQPKDVALSLRWGGRARTLRMTRVFASLCLGVIPLLAAWYLCATVYVVFHDTLLASLMTRQTDMQYSYEDRIAALKTELDRQTSQNLVDRHALDTAVRDLDERSARLESRAAMIDTLVAETTSKAGHAAHGPSLDPASLSPDLSSLTTTPTPFNTPASQAPRTRPSLDQSSDASVPHQSDADRRLMADNGDQWSQALDTALSLVEARQAHTVGRLQGPPLQAVERMRAALEQTGLQGHLQSDVGGPYVPLSADGENLDFDQSVQLVKATIEQVSRLSEIVDRVPLRKPLEGPIEVTSTFGARLDPFYGRPAMHTGIDLHENYGDAVRATAAGTITVAGSEGGYGNMVEIDHGNGLTTRYAHMSYIAVVVHQRVEPGTIVGRVGSTGRATGPHLHYETRINGEPVDPSRFLKAGAGLFPG